MPMSTSDARKRHAPEPSRFLPVERVQALSPAALDIAAAYVAGWFVDHAEMDRDRFLMLVAEAEGAVR